MKKIPTLFTRIFVGNRIVDIRDEITKGCERAFLYGIATEKVDGSCCAVIDGIFYKRYDAKKGKTPPADAIPCCDPDPITGHWPHWVPVYHNDPADKWFMAAYSNTPYTITDGTYEAIGKHFNGNPYNMSYDILSPHGIVDIIVERDFTSIREYLEKTPLEGIVFWLDGKPVCKIKRTDFGFEWPVKEAKE